MQVGVRRREPELALILAFVQTADKVAVALRSAPVRHRRGYGKRGKHRDAQHDNDKQHRYAAGAKLFSVHRHSSDRRYAVTVSEYTGSSPAAPADRIAVSIRPAAVSLSERSTRRT